MIPSTISIKVEFGGGLELLFSNQRTHRVTLPARIPESRTDEENEKAEEQRQETAEGRPIDIEYLILWLRDNLLKERAELFVENGTVRPGILVLVNDTDWELEGEGQYQLKDGDEIVFISTLHGG
ncbi:ubiquitin-like modifier 1 [Laetiporus sulphureus 93-53]|uniref:Ubiquitin-related modifier 1 n=1 Tax=Laetiporus sulphureus 93-53 TaxID=1314785 RepID=A0A165F1C9_9APHY|nr:ubiquitin-like modifier 1 [Laetiporus sulphureus 93-53]KZT08164.1 ubiquitin-like modifier 1 [Laetiporus sulphureus 93-53]